MKGPWWLVSKIAEVDDKFFKKFKNQNFQNVICFERLRVTQCVQTKSMVPTIFKTTQRGFPTRRQVKIDVLEEPSAHLSSCPQCLQRKRYPRAKGTTFGGCPEMATSPQGKLHSKMIPTTRWRFEDVSWLQGWHWNRTCYKRQQVPYLSQRQSWKGKIV